MRLLSLTRRSSFARSPCTHPPTSIPSSSASIIARSRGQSITYVTVELSDMRHSIGEAPKGFHMNGCPEMQGCGVIHVLRRGRSIAQCAASLPGSGYFNPPIWGSQGVGPLVIELRPMVTPSVRSSGTATAARQVRAGVSRVHRSQTLVQSATTELLVDAR